MIVDRSRSVERLASLKQPHCGEVSQFDLVVRSTSLREVKQFLPIGRFMDFGALRKV